MLEKNKKYTYEELEKIISEASVKTIEKMDKDMKEAKKRNNIEHEIGMGDFAFTMQNIVVTHEMVKILLGQNEEKDLN